MPKRIAASSLALLAALFPLRPIAQEAVIRCPLIGGEVQVFREGNAEDASVFSLSMSGATREFVFLQPEESRGRNVVIHCFGKHTPGIALWGDFAADGLLRGLILAHDQRLDFTGPHAPITVYLGSEESIILFQAAGKEDGAMEFVAHVQERYSSHMSVRTLSKRPSPRGFEVVTLPAQCGRGEAAPAKPLRDSLRRWLYRQASDDGVGACWENAADTRRVPSPQAQK